MKGTLIGFAHAGYLLNLLTLLSNVGQIWLCVVCQLFKGSGCEISGQVMLLENSWAHTEIGSECVRLHF